MREIRHGNFLLRDYEVPVVVKPVAWLSEADTFNPRIETEQIREVVYDGTLWPDSDELVDALTAYRSSFGRAPDRIVLPAMHGATFYGVEIVSGGGHNEFGD